MVWILASSLTRENLTFGVFMGYNCLSRKQLRVFLYLSPALKSGDFFSHCLKKHMTKTSINLPIKWRLDIKIVKKRKNLDEKPLIPNLGVLRRAKKGNKASRFFRHIFEHKRIKKLLGANLAAIVIATSFFPTNSVATSGELEEAIVGQNEISLVTERVIRYPVKNVFINQGYRLFHPGIDFDGVMGDEVFPIKNGVVEDIDYSRFAYGNAIIVKHDDGMTSLYAHLSEVFINKGDSVDTNTVIGSVGSTGRSTGSHLHLEVRNNGYPVSPYSVLPRQ